MRDEFDLATYRVGLMREQHGVAFENWDQDATAIESDYPSQDPAEVAARLAVAAQGFSEVVAAVPDDEWSRRGLRSDGSVFTIESFTRYLIHDPVHHLTDVTGERWA